jgi:hypothetical protein
MLWLHLLRHTGLACRDETVFALSSDSKGTGYLGTFFLSIFSFENARRLKREREKERRWGVDLERQADLTNLSSWWLFLEDKVYAQDPLSPYQPAADLYSVWVSTRVLY